MMITQLTQHRMLFYLLSKPEPIPQTRKNGNISQLFKAYISSKDTYSRSTKENFDRKVLIFNERYDQAGIQGEERRKAFYIMLSGKALQ